MKSVESHWSGPKALNRHCNETAKEADITLACWFLYEITQNPPKIQLSIQASFLLTPFLGLNG